MELLQCKERNLPWQCSTWWWYTLLIGGIRFRDEYGDFPSTHVPRSSKLMSSLSDNSQQTFVEHVTSTTESLAGQGTCPGQPAFSALLTSWGDSLFVGGRGGHVHHRWFSSLPASTHSRPVAQWPGVTTRNVSRHSRAPLEGRMAPSTEPQV